MAGRQWFPFLLLLGFLVGGSHGSAGDVDPTYRACVDQCEKTGSWKQLNCRGSHGSAGDVDPTYRACVDQCEKTRSWKQLNCRGDCSYYCMMQREKERATLGLSPVKYHGNGPSSAPMSLRPPPASAARAPFLLPLSRLPHSLFLSHSCIVGLNQPRKWKLG
ncbi:hypothetical protein KSP40_PGU001598 [Platanthera guangdongensis]|uniref:Post-GPI attachment to proteins factor 3 n=1 Tax=Platanthera guangdongensis TaxID=2320717 RepID=A0ABR2LEK6_9ASPA